MEKLLAVVFEDEKTAYEGARTLMALDAEGSLDVRATAVVKKNGEGTVTTKRADPGIPAMTIGGTALGSLIGLLAGPVGLGVGAAAGALSGLIADVYSSGVDADFLNDVSEALTPGKCAVVASVTEEWVTPIDTRMEALGGVVFRMLRSTSEDEHASREAAAMRAEIDQLKAELSKANANRKTKLQAQIDRLTERRAKKLADAQARSAQIKQEWQAKVEALQKKAEQEKAEAKAAIDLRIARLREGFQAHHGA